MSRALLLVVVALGGAVIGFCLAVIFYVPTVTRAPPAAAQQPDVVNAIAPLPRAPVAVTPVSIADGAQHWASQGFVEMVPPVHLPSDSVETDKISVWLKVPDGKPIGVRVVDGRPVLRFPAGSVADRVESFLVDSGPAVIDVRGTTLVDDGELWHVYVPTGDTAAATLTGWEWRRDDEPAQAAATAMLTAHLAKTPTLHDQRSPKMRVVEDYKKNNACGRCHVYDKRENLADPQAIHRPTDDNGWYVPMSVLMDTLPLEKHRARDMNADDPLISLECSDGRAPELDATDSGERHFVCANRKVPVGTLDVKAGLAKKDPHTLAVCASRKYLRDRMDADARQHFAAAFTECKL